MKSETKKAILQPKKIHDIINVLQKRKKISRQTSLLLDYHLKQKKIDFSRYGQDYLKNILDYARKNTTYYNANIGSSFSSIPLLNKDLIRENFKKIVSKKIDRMLYYKMNTGGTTGNPLEFLVSFGADPLHQAFQFKLMGYQKNDLIVSFGGFQVSKEMLKQNIFWENSSKHSLPYGKITYSAHYLNEPNLKYYYEHLAKIRPQFIRGYPSAIFELASYVAKNNLSLSSLKAIQLTGENVYPNQLTTISEVFKTKIFLQYGHSEVAVFAYTLDDTYKYYCSPFYGKTEVLDPKGNHVQKGEQGEIVATSYHNYAMPFIRYKTGDIAEYGGEEKGIVILNKIFGREQDVLYGKNKEKYLVISLVYGEHLKALGKIKNWQIIQNEPGKLQMNIVAMPTFDSSDEKEIFAKFKDIAEIDTQFNYVKEIPPTKTGKHKFLIQNIPK